MVFKTPNSFSPIEALRIKNDQRAIFASSVIVGVTASYADNAAAIAGGLSAGTIYRTGDNLKIVH